MNLKLKICLGASEPYYIDTGLKVPRDTEYYYIPNDYRNPDRCYLVDYYVKLSVDNIIRVFAVINLKDEQYLIQPELLFKTVNQASDYYIKNKPDLSYIKGVIINEKSN